MAPPLFNIDCRSQRRGGSAAFTLTECLIATALLVFAAAGVIVPLSASHRQRTTTNQANVATMLARQLLEEIASQPYAEPDGTLRASPFPGQTRANYTSLGCYNGYSDATNSMTTVDGTPIDFGPGTPTYTRNVTISYMTSRSGPVTNAGDYAIVAVTVAPPTGPSVTLSKLVTRSNQSW